MKYDVHYADPTSLSALPGGREMLRGLRTLDLATFDRCYRYVGTFEAADLDGLFALLQNGGGDLSDATIQRYVLRLVKHTSLSMGDIAVERESGKVWLLGLEGWRETPLA